MKLLTKNLKRVIAIAVLALVMMSSLNVNAQTTKTILDPKNSKEVALSATELEESVVFIRDFSKITVGTFNSLTIEFVNYNSKRKFLPAYLIDGIEYCDNGEYNDKVAGDGIFTSVKKYRVTSKSQNTGLVAFKSPNFKYAKQMNAEKKVLVLAFRVK